MDESPTKLIGEVRQQILPTPGQPECYDCEYKRNATANRPRCASTLAEGQGHRQPGGCGLRRLHAQLTDVDSSNAERIRVVLDRTSTHSPGALYQALPGCEARRILRRLEFHHVPKHASWLNMVEIGAGSAHCDPGSAQIGDRCLGTAVQRLRRPHQLDVHDRRSRGQIGRPTLSSIPFPAHPSKSHNHCAAILAVDLGARAPDLTQIPPLNIPRAGICFVDCKLGRHTDSSAQACCAGAAVAHDEQVVWLGTELEELAGAVKEWSS